MGRPHRVAALVPDHFHPFELGVACEVFGVRRDDLVDPWYDLVLVGATRALRSSVGAELVVGHGLATLARADTIVVPGWPPLEQPPAPALARALGAAARGGARIVSICSGAFLLGHAGLLDGRRATTHWMYADRLARRFPRCTVDASALYVRDGATWTSAGTAAGIDLCLALVREDHGVRVANALARRMVTAPHRPGGQAQYVESPIPTENALSEVLAWARARLGQPLGVRVLARRAGMSERTFARRFTATCGATPHAWITEQRLAHARELLEASALPIDRVAESCGYESAATLRRHFVRALRTTPSAYRRTFAQVRA